MMDPIVARKETGFSLEVFQIVASSHFEEAIEGRSASHTLPLRVVLVVDVLVDGENALALWETVWVFMPDPLAAWTAIVHLCGLSFAVNIFLLCLPHAFIADELVAARKDAGHWMIPTVAATYGKLTGVSEASYFVAFDRSQSCKIRVPGVSI